MVRHPVGFSFAVLVVVGQRSERQPVNGAGGDIGEGQ
jgi:hypothetical protein